MLRENCELLKSLYLRFKFHFIFGILRIPIYYNRTTQILLNYHTCDSIRQSSLTREAFLKHLRNLTKRENDREVQIHVPTTARHPNSIENLLFNRADRVIQL